MKIPFEEKEMELKGMSRSLFGTIPIFSYPATFAEAVRATYLDHEPVWMLTGCENAVFTPHIIPDNVARGFVFEGKPFDNNANAGGKDMFGIEWEYVPMVGGSMVRPGNPFMEDMFNWKEKLVWPDVDSWDWEGCRADNTEYVGGGKDVTVWIQTGWFERLISFMDFENAIMALFDEDQQDLILEFFDKLADLYIDIIDHFVKYFPETNHFYIHDDWGAQKETFFSPALVEKMIVPSMRRVTDHIHALGRIAELHSCGQIYKQVPNMIKAGWDCWTGQAMNDTQAIYEEFGDQIVIGVVPDVFDPETVSEEEQRRLGAEFAEKFCRPGKPAVMNFIGAQFVTPAFREGLYRKSREIYSK